jgi:hypothetical protein
VILIVDRTMSSHHNHGHSAAGHSQPPTQAQAPHSDASSTAVLLAGGLLKLEPLTPRAAETAGALGPLDAPVAAGRARAHSGDFQTAGSDAAVKFLDEQLAAVRKQLVAVRAKNDFFSFFFFLQIFSRFLQIFFLTHISLRLRAKRTPTRASN